MRTTLRPVAVLALCGAALAAAPAVAAATAHAKSAGQAKSAKPHKRKPAKSPASAQGDGGAVYGSGNTATTPTAAGGTTTTATGGASVGGASAPTSPAQGSTGGVTKANSGSSSVSAPSASTGAIGATGVGGPTGAAAPTGASGSTGTTGGATAPSGPTGATGPTGPTTPGPVAKILADGLAEAPDGAPLAVKQAIAAANQLIGQPYLYGGGHKSFISHGYDCSGAVSYALHGASLLASPLDSSSLEQWGSAGRGSWITVFTNPAHAYVDIAGIRLDTSRAGDPGGKSGPRWRPLLASNAGFAARHPAGL